MGGTVGFVLRRLASFVPTLAGLIALTFVIARMIPVDPVIAVLGPNADQAAYEAMRIKLGLNLPLWEQFLIYVGQLLHGDFGQAMLSGNSVADDIARVFPATLELASLAIVVGGVLGVLLGVVAARYRGTAADHAVRVAGLLGHSAPSFWLGLVGLLVFYSWLGWVGGGGEIDVYYVGEVPDVTGMLLIDSLLAGQLEVFWNALKHIILPALILGYGATAIISRMTRSFMIEQLGQEYVMIARIKGLSERRVIWRHAFINVSVQLITVLALAYGGLLEGSVLVETVFGWPGLGHYFTTALLNGDMNATLGCTVVIGATFMLLNFFADLLYRLLDRRIS